MPENLFPDRPWEPGNNPKTAANEFLKNDDRFCRDPEWESKLQVTVAPGGFLLRVK
jgi:cephalosporin hydroxylase